MQLLGGGLQADVNSHWIAANLLSTSYLQGLPVATQLHEQLL